jgi:hypothetical protein
MEHQPAFSAINYTNDYVWGDGDLCVDANGSVYSLSEDDWSLVRYDPGRTRSCAWARCTRTIRRGS